MTNRELLLLPAPEGWVPEIGEHIVVPSTKPSQKWKGYGYCARVVKILDDIVEVYTYQFKARQQFLLKDVKPGRKAREKFRAQLTQITPASRD